MKTLLTIGGNTYLVNSDPTQVMKMMQGAVRTSYESHYGPDGDRYGEHMFSAVVKEPKPERVRVEIIDGAEVVTKAEWDARVKESDDAIAMQAEAKSKTLSQAA